MKIQLSSLAIAGQQLRYSLTATSLHTKINVYLNSMLIASHECPDPPCHDLAVHVPAASTGSTLRLVAIDSKGQSVETSAVVIGESRGTPSPRGTPA